MTVFLSGGSNTLTEEGWVSLFREKMRGIERVENISIGAAPSFLGAFRTIHTTDLQPGDTLVWEYAINDALHIDKKNYNENSLIEAVEWSIQHCANIGVKFCALIFQPLNREKQAEMPSHRRKLRSLFASFEVPFFDVSSEFVKRRARHSRIPDRQYRNNAHYERAGKISEFIARGAFEAVRQAAVPGTKRAGGSVPVFYDRFQIDALEEFENSVIKLPVWNPGAEGLRGTFRGDGKVVGMILTSTKWGGVFDVEVAAKSLRLSATFREKRFNKTMLKFISLPTLAGDELGFAHGDQFSISFADETDGMLVDMQFQRHLTDEIVAAREARVVAIITKQETYQWDEDQAENCEEAV